MTLTHTHTFSLFPTPLFHTHIHMYGIQFATRVQALIGATGESALKGGVVKFLSTFVTETLLPYLSGA